MSLDRLQKEIDALTYNARTVLNALIRSVTAAGNNRGFKATRADETIYLSRIDIYRLYKFYQEWSANEFATEDVEATEDSGALEGFDTIRASHDVTPVTVGEGEQDTTATSTALTKHGKILFKTTENADNTDEQWIALVKNHNNPKLVTNSSPIPLNLRTPVFDENMSTAHYHNYPTYLFPMDYFKIDVLGYSGDDSPHTLAGKSWTIQADDFIRLNSRGVSLGAILPEGEYKTLDKRTGNYALSFGYNCHAQATYSISGGVNSIVPFNETTDDGTRDTTAAMAIGSANIASGRYASSVGGRLNSTSNDYSVVSGGRRNTVTAFAGGILGGQDNTVGGRIFSFRFPTGVVSTNITEEDASTTTEDTETTSGNNVIMVSGNRSTVFAVNQQVTVFDFTFKSSDGKNRNVYYQANGSARQAIHDTVDSVSYVPTTEDDPNAGWTKITLRNDIPEKGIITGGKVSITKADGIWRGRFSGAVGRLLVVEGREQFVVGVSNKVQRDARFLVGSGGKTNSFEVYNNKFIAYGISNRTNTFTVENEDTNSRETATSFVGLEFAEKGLDVLVGHNRFRLYRTVIVDGIQNTGFELISKIGQEGSEFGIKGNTGSGINIYTQRPFRNINLHTGTEDIATSFGGVRNSGDIGLYSAKRVYMVGKEGVTIRAATGAENQGVLTLEWETRLTLIGDTWGTLPADQNQYAHYMADEINDLNAQYIGTSGSHGVVTLYKSGFYRVNGELNSILGTTAYANRENTVREITTGQTTPTDYFLFNVGYKTSDNKYFNWQMFIGADPRISENVHIGVRRGYSKDGNVANLNTYYTNSAINGNNIKYIGWLQDYQYTYTFDNPNNPTQVTFGTWSEVPNVSITDNILSSDDSDDWVGGVSSNVDTAYESSHTDGLTSRTLRYTKMNNLVFFQLVVQLAHIDNSDNDLAFILRPSTDTADWSKIFLPAENAKYPTFIDSNRYREFSDAGRPWHKLYTCKVVKNGDNPNEVIFLITTSAPSGTSVVETGNIFTEYDNNKTLSFAGSYETQYNTTEEG